MQSLVQLPACPFPLTLDNKSSQANETLMIQSIFFEFDQRTNTDLRSLDRMFCQDVGVLGTSDILRLLLTCAAITLQC